MATTISPIRTNKAVIAGSVFSQFKFSHFLSAAAKIKTAPAITIMAVAIRPSCADSESPSRAFALVPHFMMPAMIDETSANRMVIAAILPLTLVTSTLEITHNAAARMPTAPAIFNKILALMSFCQRTRASRAESNTPLMLFPIPLKFSSKSVNASANFLTLLKMPARSPVPIKSVIVTPEKMLLIFSITGAKNAPIFSTIFEKTSLTLEPAVFNDSNAVFAAPRSSSALPRIFWNAAVTVSFKELTHGNVSRIFSPNSLSFSPIKEKMSRKDSNFEKSIPVHDPIKSST